jgi:hypothetical protein
MFRILSGLIAVVLLAASGVSHRIWTGAWSVSGEPALSASRLPALPATLGDWVGVDTEVDGKQLAQAEAAGYLARRYVQRRSGAEVSLFIICGRPGPVSVHTPDICYGGIGFRLAGAESHYRAEGNADTPSAEFITGNFVKPDPALPQNLRIYWGWKAGSGWRAPANPRMTFGAVPALYKMYLVYRPLPGVELPQRDPCQDFLRDLLPELEKTLSPAS